MDETTLYLQHDNGSVSRVTTTQPRDEVTLPEGAVEITFDAYEAARADIAAHNEAYVNQLLEAEQQQRIEDYEALIAVNVPEATARRLTGHVAEGV